MNENVKGMDWMQPRVEYPPPKIIYESKLLGAESLFSYDWRPAKDSNFHRLEGHIHCCQR